MHSETDSWSASIYWQHHPEIDRLKLSGPLGQGAVVIVLQGGCMSVARGRDDVEYSCDPDALVRRRVGVFVPFLDLPFWVLGLPGLNSDHDDIPGGFVQSGWSVRIKQFMRVGDDVMPRKILIAKSKTKLKLLIDHWVLDEG